MTQGENRKKKLGDVWRRDWDNVTKNGLTGNGKFEKNDNKESKNAIIGII